QFEFLIRIVDLNVQHSILERGLTESIIGFKSALVKLRSSSEISHFPQCQAVVEVRNRTIGIGFEAFLVFLSRAQELFHAELEVSEFQVHVESIEYEA